MIIVDPTGLGEEPHVLMTVAIANGAEDSIQLFICGRSSFMPAI